MFIIFFITIINQNNNNCNLLPAQPQSFSRIKMFKIFIAFANYIECLPAGHPCPLDLPDLPDLPSLPSLPVLPVRQVRPVLPVQVIKAAAVVRAVITIEEVINLIIMNMNMEIDEILFPSIFWIVLNTLINYITICNLQKQTCFVFR